MDSCMLVRNREWRLIVEGVESRRMATILLLPSNGYDEMRNHGEAS